MKRAGPKSFRLPATFFARLRAYSQEHRLSVAATLRIAGLRGLALMEAEAAKRLDSPQQSLPLEVPAPQPPRRRVLSPGVG